MLPPQVLQVGRGVDIERSPGQVEEMNLPAGPGGEQRPQTSISVQLKGKAIQPARQDEGNCGPTFQATCHDIASGQAPTIKKPKQIASAQQGQIQRQDQQCRLEPARAHATDYRRRQPLVAVRIGDAAPAIGQRSGPQWRTRRRDHEDALPGKGSQQRLQVLPQGPAVQARLSLGAAETS